jgi:hypothetical protein
MKKFIIIVLLLIILIVAGAGAYLYLNANSLIAGLKPELEKIASSALATPVRIGSINLGLGLSPTISVSEVSIGSEEKESNTKNLSVGNVLLSVDLIPLLSKELRVNKLTIENPNISAIKTSAGLQIAGLPTNTSDNKPSTPASQNQVQIPNKAAPSLPLAFALKDFSLTGGTITLTDQTKQGPLAEIAISDLTISSGLTVSDAKIELAQSKIKALINKSLPIQINAAHLELNPKSMDAVLEQLSIETLKTTFSIDGAVNLTDMKGKFLLSSNGLNLSELSPLYTFVPALKLFPLSGIVTPQLTLTLDSATQYDLTGTAKLSAISTIVNNFKFDDLTGTVKINANPSEQKVQDAEALTLNFQGAPIKLSFLAGLRGTLGFLDKLELTAFSGKITGKADSQLSPPQIFHTQLDLNTLSIDQALSALSGKAESPLSGSVENVNINLTGELGQALKTTTSGRINLKIKDALLKQVNIAQEAFKGILSLPFIASRLASLPTEFQQELSAADTKIRLISSSLQGDKGVFTTNDFTLLGSFFTVRGKGSLSMSGAVDLSCAISFNEKFTALLIEKVKELKSAVDRNGELTFPLSISGTAPALTVVPDMKALIKLGAEALVRDGAEQLINKALGNKGGSNKDLGKLFGF